MTEGIGFMTGFSLRWLRDAFFEPLRQASNGQQSSFELMENLAASTSLGANGVIATMAKPMHSDGWVQPPLGLLGFDINRPGAALGSAIRAFMEAGAFLAHNHLQTLERLSGMHFDTLQFTGGSSQGQTWAQIVADVTGRCIDIPTVKETTALGCAMLAASGVDLFGSLDEALAAMASPVERRVEPNPANHAAYREIEARWRAVTDGAFDMGERNLLKPLWRPAGARKRQAAQI
jgi:autoinducer 2 (AI-2) kinase